MVRCQWKPQFSLRSLFIVFTLLIIPIYLLSLNVDQKRRERQFVTSVTAIGGNVAYDWEWDATTPPGPFWLRRAFGENFFAQIRHVSFFQNATLDDAKFAALDIPPRIPVLWLDFSRITDKGLANIRGLTALKDLGLYNTQITDEGLAHVEHLTQLESLFLDGTLVADAGLKHLEHLTHLTDLHLSRTQVSDAGLKHMVATRAPLLVSRLKPMG